MRYEIRDIAPPFGVKAAMELQAEAERRKRATVLESEGDKQSAINKAEGEKEAKILASEAKSQEMINKAEGEAQSILRIADATARGITTVAKSVGQRNASGAIQLKIAEQYISAFEKLARETNTIVLPQNLSDPNAMVAQAMAIYNSFGQNKGKQALDAVTGVPSAETDLETEEDAAEEDPQKDPPKPPFSLQS